MPSTAGDFTRRKATGAYVTCGVTEANAIECAKTPDNVPLNVDVSTG